MSAGCGLRKGIRRLMDAFALALVSLRQGLLRAARARLRNAAWAEDAVSETLLAALERRPTIDDPSRLRAWLHVVLHHKVVDQIRLHVGDERIIMVGDLQDLEMLQDVASDPAPAHDDPFRHAAGSQFVRALEHRLRELPARQARAFVLKECEGASTGEICAELSMTSVCVGVTLHRARQALRAGLAGHRDRGRRGTRQ